MNDDFDPGRSSLLDAFAKSETEAQEMTALPAAVSRYQPFPVHMGAQKVPVARDEQKILKTLRVLAHAAGQEWYYRFPVKKRGGGVDYIEGPSIKLADEVARLYGNVFVGTEVEDAGEFWLIHGLFYDKETGYTLKRPFQQRKSQRSMRGDADRALDIAIQIGISKAQRNVVVHALPSIVDFAYEEARNAIVERIGKNIEHYRKVALERLKDLDVDVHRAEAVVGRPLSEWLAPDIARVGAMVKGVQEGMATVDDSFPALKAAEQPHSSPLEQFAQEGQENGQGGGSGADQGDDRRTSGSDASSGPKGA